MGVPNVGGLSLGQWSAICHVWNKAHQEKSETEAPSDDEFEQAVLAARGVS